MEAKRFLIVTNENIEVNRMIHVLLTRLKYRGFPTLEIAETATCFCIEETIVGFNNTSYGGPNWSGFDTYKKLNVEEGLNFLLNRGKVNWEALKIGDGFIGPITGKVFMKVSEIASISIDNFVIHQCSKVSVTPVNLKIEVVK